MTESFPISLITPEAILFQGQASMVEAPGTEGDFGVLKGHMPFISTLKPGIVKLHKDDGEQKVFVTGGVAEVNPESCTILAERAVDISGLTSADAQTRLTEARAKLDAAFDDKAKAGAQADLEIAEAIAASLR